MRLGVAYVVPAHGETPRGVDEADRVGIETTRDRVHDSEFTESVDDVEDHDSGDGEADQDGSRATFGQGAS